MLLDSSGTKFAGLAVGVYLSFMLFGLAQEQVHKGNWGPEGERFRFPLFLITVQSFCNMFVALMALGWSHALRHVFSPTKPAQLSLFGKCPWYVYACTSLSYILGLLFSNSALQHVDYPTQVLAKSCKMVAVMLAGVVLARRKYSLPQYTSVLILTGGIFMFSFFRSSGKAAGDPTSTLGIALLVMSLTCDGVTSVMQDKYISRHKPTAMQMNVSVNMFAFIYSLAALVLSGQLMSVLSFLAEADRRLSIAVLAFGLTSGVGQLFLFGLIRNFGALAATIATTTRKFFTILLSVVLYGHTIPPLSWIGVAMVFLGLGFNIYSKVAGKSKKSTQVNAPSIFETQPVAVNADPYDSDASYAPSERDLESDVESDVASVTMDSEVDR